MICKHCQSTNTVKFGIKRNKQRYLCRDCKKTFLEFYNFDRKHYSVEVIASAWELYFRGVSLRNIKFYLKSQYHIKKLTHVTIFYWIQTYSVVMKKYTDQFMPKKIDVIQMDETAFIISRQSYANWYNKAWLWVGLDAKTKLLVSSHISMERDGINATKFMNKIKLTPRIVISDKLHCYKIPIKKRWKGKVKHLTVNKDRTTFSNNCLERWNGFFKDRIIPMRGFGAIHSANAFMDGLQVYNNFIKHHSSLDGLTPAKAHGINLELGENPVLELLKLSTLFLT